MLNRLLYHTWKQVEHCGQREDPDRGLPLNHVDRPHECAEDIRKGINDEVDPEFNRFAAQPTRRENLGHVVKNDVDELEIKKRDHEADGVHPAAAAAPDALTPSPKRTMCVVAQAAGPGQLIATAPADVSKHAADALGAALGWLVVWLGQISGSLQSESP